MASCALAAGTIDLGSLHRLHDADSLLPVLISTQHWEPFYWGQDRFGMLLPLLAWPFRDPLTNLLAQGWLATFAGLLTFFLLARFVRVPQFWFCGLVSAATFLVFCPAPLKAQLFLPGQPYGVSLALGLGGLLLWDVGGSACRVAGLAMMLCAHWVNVGTWLLLAPLAISRGVLARAPRTALGDGLLVLVGAASGWGLMTISPSHLTSRTILSARQWPESWRLLAANAWSGAEPWLLVGALLGSAGMVGSFLTRRNDSMHVRSATAVLIGSGLAYWLVVGTMEWVKLNASLERYLIPAIIALGTACIALATAPLGDWAERHVRATRAALPATLFVAAIAAYGFPAVAGVRADIDRVGNKAGWTDEIVAARCTHLAGTYWQVWPAVFYANLLLHERAEHRVLWGVTYRGGEARVRWSSMPRDRYRVCLAPSDPEASTWMERFGLETLMPVSESSGLRVLSASP